MKVQKCICCNKKVELIWDDLDFLKSATYISIEPEYGSKYDGEIYKFIICDNCITIKSQRNALRFIPQTINPTFFTKIKKNRKNGRKEKYDRKQMFTECVITVCYDYILS